MSESVLVVGGGEPISPREMHALSRHSVVIAADSGIDRAYECDLTIDIAIGDFDSVTGQGLLRAESAGAEICRFPGVKNETDLELALLHAMSLEPDRILVVAIGGGRFDHLLSSTLLLADDRLANIDVQALVGNHWLTVVRDSRALTGSVGSTVTLLPIGGPAIGVSTNGLEYPLNAETLPAGSPRGMSNLFSAPLAVVDVQSGVLFALQELPA